MLSDAEHVMMDQVQLSSAKPQSKSRDDLQQQHGSKEAHSAQNEGLSGLIHAVRSVRLVSRLALICPALLLFIPEGFGLGCHSFPALS